MKKYTCIFPGLYNYILTKDVGMIPYTLSGKYDTKIITYDNDNFIYMDDILKKNNFSLEILEDSGNEKEDVKRYIKKHAKSIDILQLYHLRYNQLPHYIWTYKRNNRQGKIYLKLDANNDYIDFLVKRKGISAIMRRLYVKIMLRFVDIISIETKRNFQVLSDSNLIDKNKLIHVPNGVIKGNIPLSSKEKIILYVGFIEKKNKSIDKLLSAISNIDLKDWKVVLVGEVLDDMKSFLEEYFINHPELKEKVILKGYISDKEVLAQEYARSSIYCCTSIKESFGISILESAYYGNYLISTNVGASPDILDETEYGTLTEIENLSNTLEYTLNNWDKIRKNPEDIQNIVYSKFSWNKICEKIVEKIE